MWSVLEVSITKGPEPPGRAVPTVCFGRRLACWPRPCPRHGQLHRGTALEWLVRSPIRRFCVKDLGVAQSTLRQTSPPPAGEVRNSCTQEASGEFSVGVDYTGLQPSPQLLLHSYLRSVGT